MYAGWATLDHRRRDRHRTTTDQGRSNCMARRSVGSDTRVAGPERAALVGMVAGRARRLDAERSLDELAGLADAAGAKVVLRTLQERPKPDPATFLGSGKVKALAESCAEMGVDLVVFDNELSPSQLRQ